MPITMMKNYEHSSQHICQWFLQPLNAIYIYLSQLGFKWHHSCFLKWIMYSFIASWNAELSTLGGWWNQTPRTNMGIYDTHINKPALFSIVHLPNLGSSYFPFCSNSNCSWFAYWLRSLSHGLSGIGSWKVALTPTQHRSAMPTLTLCFGILKCLGFNNVVCATCKFLCSGSISS